MTTAVRLAAFAAVGAAVFVGAIGLGRAVDADAGGGSEAAHGHGDAEGGHGGEHGGTADVASAGAIAQDGLRLVVDTPAPQLGVEAPLRFHILDGDETVRDFDVTHDKRMHLIVARRDLSGFQHLHPTQEADGSWSVPLRLDEAGTYRVFADFSTDGERMTLGTDLAVAGDFAPHALPAVADSDRTGPYEVRVRDDGDGLDFEVLRDGVPVQDLEPYLGARGHLVALREGDLAFLHVHPDEDGEAQPGHIGFGVEYPSAGRYRLFLQFKHQGVVQTVAFTREVAP